MASGRSVYLRKSLHPHSSTNGTYRLLSQRIIGQGPTNPTWLHARAWLGHLRHECQFLLKQLRLQHRRLVRDDSESDSKLLLRYLGVENPVRNHSQLRCVASDLGSRFRGQILYGYGDQECRGYSQETLSIVTRSSRSSFGFRWCRSLQDGSNRRMLLFWWFSYLWTRAIPCVHARKESSKNIHQSQIHSMRKLQSSIDNQAFFFTVIEYNGIISNKCSAVALSAPDSYRLILPLWSSKQKIPAAFQVELSRQWKWILFWASSIFFFHSQGKKTEASLFSCPVNRLWTFRAAISRDGTFGFFFFFFFFLTNSFFPFEAFYLRTFFPSPSLLAGRELSISFR